jgi:hypothetical protein
LKLFAFVVALLEVSSILLWVLFLEAAWWKNSGYRLKFWFLSCPYQKIEAE